METWIECRVENRITNCKGSSRMDVGTPEIQTVSKVRRRTVSTGSRVGDGLQGKLFTHNFNIFIFIIIL